MLCGCKKNVPAVINWTFHVILSIIQLGHGIEELLSDMQERTSERIVNLIVRLVICNSETNLHIMSSLTAVVSRWAVLLIVSCCFHF